MDVPKNCQTLKTWYAKASLCGLGLFAVAIAATAFMVNDLQNVFGEVKIANIRDLRQVVSDYTFLHEARRMKAMGVQGQVDRRTKKTKGGKDLHLVWEIAYPFAGSNVLLGILEDATGYSMATNYADAVESNRGPVTGYDGVPVLSDMPHGPFMHHINKALPPSGNVLVKTHCAGFCIDSGESDCKLKDYAIPLNDLKIFYTSCSSGTQVKGVQESIETYNGYKIEKAMILARHPIQMVVMRFINILEAHPVKEMPYMMNSVGIRKYCDEYDNQRGSELLENWYEAESLEMVKNGDVPCHSEIYRIARFYTQALKLMNVMDEEYLVVRFEDYEDDMGETLSKIMDFMGFGMKENQRTEKLFNRVGKDNNDMFTKDEVSKMLMFFKKNASAKANELFGDYA